MAKKEEDVSFNGVVAQMNKDYGTGSVVSMADKIEDGYDVVSTGSIAFDKSLGIGGWQPGKLYELMGWEGTGKAQPLSSKILTPTGWKTMGEMELGTIVSTPDGGDSTVIGVFPQGEQDVYKITFDDKTYTYCTLDHLWSVNTRKNPEIGEVLSVKELLERKLKKSNDTRKFNIPTTKPLNFQQFGKITINPYLLGLLLGDGGLTDNSVKITTADEEVLKEISYILETEYVDMKLSKKMGKYTYNLRKKGNGKKSNKIYEEIKELGLLGKYSYEKHIPKEYLFTSIENRIALLQGLMDSDGSVENQTLSYSTTSLQLNKDFEELCRGLGFRCNTSSRVTKYTSPSGTKLDGRVSYRSTLLMNTFLFNPFRLTRKKNLFGGVRSGFADRYIESIENTGKKEQCQCIAIGHPDHLYITDNYIVTHNTTICGHAAKGFQEKFPDKKVVYIDAEHALDKKYFKALGVDVDKMFLSQPDYGEMGYNIAEKLVASGEVSLLIIDSNTAMLPKKVIDGEAGDNALGLQARLNSQMWPKIKNKLIKGNTCVIVISQFREKIGVMFGSPVTTNGGHALKFYTDVRIEVSKSEDKEGGGSLTKIKVKKNKMAPPFVEGQFFIKWGEGIDNVQEILDLAVEANIVKKSGSWYSYMEDKIGQGEQAVKQLLIDNPELFQEIKEKVLKDGI